MIQIEYKCGCKEVNFNYDKCPIHQEKMIKKFTIDKVLLSKIKAQIELMTANNLLTINEIEKIQNEVALQIDLSKFENWYYWVNQEALDIDCQLLMYREN
jgi:hypothetical protein